LFDLLLYINQPLFPSQSQSQQTVPATATAIPSTSMSDSQSTESVSVTDDGLSHPQSKTLVGRIPRAARPACTEELLSLILRCIVSAPKDKSAWKELFHFGPIILAKPKRGGANRNVSNIINKRVARCGTEVYRRLICGTADIQQGH